MGTSSRNSEQCVIQNKRSDTKYVVALYHIDGESGWHDGTESRKFTDLTVFDYYISNLVIRCYDDMDNIIFTFVCDAPNDHVIIMSDLVVSMSKMT
jgi:hypothetical protein